MIEEHKICKLPTGALLEVQIHYKGVNAFLTKSLLEKSILFISLIAEYVICALK